MNDDEVVAGGLDAGELQAGIVGIGCRGVGVGVVLCVGCRDKTVS